MTIYKTLNQFIDEQITKFEIPDTEENQKKLRAKFMRVLKDLKIWDNAETRTIGKAKTKVFNEIQLSKLYSEVQDYLLKRSPINKNDFDEYISEATKTIENFYNRTYEDDITEELSSQYAPPTVSSKELNQVMLQGLFEIFYEPIDVKRWNDDYAAAHFTDVQDFDTLESYLLQKRLNNPLKAYTKRKDNQ